MMFISQKTQKERTNSRSRQIFTKGRRRPQDDLTNRFDEIVMDIKERNETF